MTLKQSDPLHITSSNHHPVHQTQTDTYRHTNRHRHMRMLAHTQIYSKTHTNTPFPLHPPQAYTSSCPPCVTSSPSTVRPLPPQPPCVHPSSRHSTWQGCRRTAHSCLGQAASWPARLPHLCHWHQVSVWVGGALSACLLPGATLLLLRFCFLHQSVYGIYMPYHALGGRMKQHSYGTHAGNAGNGS